MIKSVPTNIISGFLGVGKTTFIQRLLADKPADERWAILVNEFGEVGIDGSIFKGKQENNIFVREVPGGCMCCTAGLTMQVALNQLLAASKPDRLIIEPTGLGHLDEVLDILTEEHYQEVLNLGSVLTLVDSRKLVDERYTTNATFKQQIALADTIVSAKIDLCSEKDQQVLDEFVEGFGDKPIVRANADIQAHLNHLKQPTDYRSQKHNHAHSHSHNAIPPVVSAPEEGFTSIDNEGEGFFSRGWIFAPDAIFDQVKLVSLFQDEQIERLKGVFISTNGVFVINKADDVLSVQAIDDALDSRFEIISRSKIDWNTYEMHLQACLVPTKEHF